MNARSLYYDHFASRLFERYGLVATDRLYHDIIRQIQNNNQVTRIIGLNNQRSIHCVYAEGKRVYVIYRKHKKALVTALPPTKYLHEGFRKAKLNAS